MLHAYDVDIPTRKDSGLNAWLIPSGPGDGTTPGLDIKDGKMAKGAWAYRLMR
jgi:hypothetical protein